MEMNDYYWDFKHMSLFVKKICIVAGEKGTSSLNQMYHCVSANRTIIFQINCIIAGEECTSSLDQLYHVCQQTELLFFKSTVLLQVRNAHPVWTSCTTCVSDYWISSTWSTVMSTPAYTRWLLQVHPSLTKTG